jgi:S-adenosylmethionine decarboxylase
MVEQELPSGGLLIYQSFNAMGEISTGSPRSVLNCFVDDNLESGAKDTKMNAFLLWEEDAAQEIDERDGKKMRSS